MGNAYLCDRCGETFSGTPCIRLKAKGKPIYADYKNELEVCKECERAYGEWVKDGRRENDG